MQNNLPIIYLFIYVNDLEASRGFYETKLGFRVIEEDNSSVKYDGGQIILGLNKAQDYGIHLDGSPDTSSLIVFHVDEIDVARASLEKRGIVFAGKTEKYEIGATASFYDLDGHCFALYEPSEESMTWPSAEKIRSILNQRICSADLENASSEQDSGGEENEDFALGSRKMLYLFLFVDDVNKASEFYNRKLGLHILEEDSGVGVVKYDAGGIILATHLVEGDPVTKTGADDLKQPRGIAPVFHVSSIQSTFEKLAASEVKFTTGIIHSEIGKIAKFEDLSGHVFYLYEPSLEALSWPSGSKIKQLIDC